MTPPASPEASILALLKSRGATSAPAIGTACRMAPGEVRGHLVMLETMRLVIGRNDASTPPRRLYALTAEGVRKAAS